MRIRYEVTREDVAALNLYLWRSNPTLRRQALFGRLALPVFLMAVGVVYVAADQSYLPLYTFGALSVLYIVFAGRLQRRAVAKQSTRLIGEGDKGTILGDHQLEVGEGWLYESSALVQSRYSYEAVVRLVVTPEQMFIFTDAIRAMVVSRSRVVEGNFDMFAAALQERLDAVGGTGIGKAEPLVVLGEAPVVPLSYGAQSSQSCGTASFVMGLVALGLLTACFAGGVMFEGMRPGAIVSCRQAAVAIAIVVMLVFLVNVVGIVLGIAGLGQSGHRVLAAVGLAVNLLFLVGFLGLFLLGAVLGGGG